jgi:lysophospholipase L1-like esterase
MTKSGPIITLVLALTLVISALANAVLFYQGRRFYLQLNELRLDPYELSAFSSISAPNEAVMVFYGDSRAAEWPAPVDSDFTYINRGIAGHTTAQVVGRFREHVLDLNPDFILLQAGINDLKTIPLFPDRMDSVVGAAFENIETLLRMSRDQNTCVILTTVFPVGKVPLYRRPFWSSDVEIARRTLNDKLLQLASEHVKILDFDAILQAPLGKRVSPYYRDMLHLTPAAYARISPYVTDAAHQLAKNQKCGFHDRARGPE